MPKPRLLLILVLCANLMFGSEGRGVVKFGGLPVPGATVTAAQGDKTFTAITDETGAYSFSDLADGVWNEKVEMLGFASAAQDVNVGPGAPGPVWELKVLSFDQIKAMAPAAPPPEVAAPVVTSTTAVPEADPKKAAAANAKKPAATKPGFQRTEVAQTSAAAPPPPPAETASAADSTDSFAVSGSANNGAASPFATSPAFGNGRRGRGSLYNGTLGLAIGNSYLDARPYSLTGQDTPKAAYNHINASMAFGGPVRIPHIFTGVTPLNFFITYQLARNRNANTEPYLVPTVDQRNGILGNGTVIPQNQISPQAKVLLAFYPLPNFSGSNRYNYQRDLRSTNNSDNLQSRLSKSIGRTNQVFGTFAWQRGGGESVNLFDFIDTNHTTGIDFTANWQKRFNNRIFGTFKYQFNRLNMSATPFFANKTNVSAQAGITGNNQDPNNWGPPGLNFSSGIASLNDGQQYLNRSQTQALGLNMFVSHSPHNITIVADYRRQLFNNLGQQNARGDFAFTGAAAGFDFADFLLGVPDTSNIAFGNADKYFRSNVWDFGITDDWRLSPSFTLNAGLRWDYNSPITEKYGRLVNLEVGPNFSTAAAVVANQTSHQLLNPNRNGFQPRIGTAWRPISGSSLVVRMGYGITRDTSVYQSIATRMAQQAPLSKSLSVQNTPENPLTLANGFIPSAASTPNTFAVDPNFRPGYVHTWKVDVQRDLPFSLVMIATYLGIKGSHAQQVFLPNTYPTGAVNPCPSCPAGFTFLTSGGNSTREAGTLELRRRLRSGFTATLRYTYSKAIDDAALGGQGQGGQVIAQNWLNLSGERGLSPFDQRHVATLQLQHTWKQWMGTSMITAGTGTPLTPTIIGAVARTGVIGPIRPNYTGLDVYNAPSGLSLNPLAYTAAPLGQWGNAGRNSITGPSRFLLDASVGRSFRLKDKWDVDFRLNAANALNHVVFASWNTVVGNSQFGLPTRANGMRTLQAVMRVRF